ncbi:XPA protein C-terminus-domain-containing protein [Scheffersomyces amazonensis]|uniref:XPA protein C-terminus-domain-containing protein n=1 Tax=Scheffersomyces amazonensis TaxID=1078765 RepID=UPI00315DEE25
MAFSRGSLTEEQRARIEANRKRALERLKARQGGGTSSNTDSTNHTSSINTNALGSSSNNGKSTINSTSNGDGSSSLAVQRASTMSQLRDSNTPIVAKFVDPTRKELTIEQKRIIEANREKALQIRKRLAEGNRDGTINNSGGDGIRLGSSNNQEDFKVTKKSYKYEPPPIRKKDYIEYDFSTMKDSRGGFLPDQDESNLTEAQQKEAMALEEWKEKQKRLQEIRDLPPPLNIEDAPKCFECGSIEIDPNLFTNFKVRACRKCMKEKPEKYSLLTKTECREDYLLTDPELRDVNLLPRIEKPNPHGYSRMQLYLRFQVEEFAWKKWGSAEGLDKEWERRETNRLKRRDKKYQDQLKEMRKRTRAEEYTRKLRNGHELGERHIHDWSAPLSISGPHENMIKRRCIGCGMETEEIII